MKVIHNPQNPDGAIWVLGTSRNEPENMIKEFSDELAKLIQKHLEEKIGFKGTTTAKPIFIAKFNPGDHEHWIAAIGNEAPNPEEFAVEITIKGVDRTGQKLDKTVTLMKKNLGFDVRIAIKEIPIHLDKENYKQSVFPYWGMVREPPSCGDVRPGLGSMIFGGPVWFSKLNHVWILASGAEMAELSISKVSEQL
jgi:hypothetical protein